jgi:hypothetical protein
VLDEGSLGNRPLVVCARHVRAELTVMMLYAAAAKPMSATAAIGSAALSWGLTASRPSMRLINISQLFVVA